jgi:hypothetical protein
MLGQFIFHTCNHAGLKLKAILRNSLRNESSSDSDAKDMNVSLKIFYGGVVVFDALNFCKIPSGGYVEINEKNCPILADDEREFMLVAHCSRGEGLQYFPQEHQVVYSIRGNVRTTSLVYDQLPVSGANFKPIVLLAPKVWLSNDVNTIISFTCSDDRNTERVAVTTWKIDILAQNGNIHRTLKLDLKQNDVYLLDVKEVLAGLVKLTDELQLINVVARGESTGCVILTFLKNKKTGALALEHSLSPHYYMNGDFDRVRHEAFLFDD